MSSENRMVIKSLKFFGIFIFINIFLIMFVSGVPVAAWKASYCADCTLPWSGTIHSDITVHAYSVNSVVCDNVCPSYTLRTCNNGTLNGTGNYASCSTAACASCSLPWGGTIAHNQSVWAYSTDSVLCDNICPSPQLRTCKNGNLNGTYTKQGCSVAACRSCTLPWGGTIVHNATVNAYSVSSVGCGLTCPSYTVRTCKDSTLQGTGNYASCSPITCVSPETCGGGGVANACGCTVSSYTPALNTFCGTKTVNTNCGYKSVTGTLPCESPNTCVSNVCQYCGDKICNNGETCDTCEEDCGACCQHSYSNVALWKSFSSTNPNPYGWDGLTDGYIAEDANQEMINWRGTYSTDYSSSFPKGVTIYLDGTYNIDLVRLYKEWGPGGSGCDDTLCADGPCGCEECKAYKSNTGTVNVFTYGEGSWTFWGTQTFSGSGGSLDWGHPRIPAEQVYIEFLDTWYQWRTEYPCLCDNCGYYVFLREAEVFGDPC